MKFFILRKNSLFLTSKVRQEGVVSRDVLYDGLKDGPINVVGVDALNGCIEDQLLLQLIGTEETTYANGPREVLLLLLLL